MNSKKRSRPDFKNDLKNETKYQERKRLDLEEEEEMFNVFCKDNGIKCNFSKRNTIPVWTMVREDRNSKYYLTKFDRLWDGAVNCECDADDGCECPEPEYYNVGDQAFTYEYGPHNQRYWDDKE